MIRPTRRKILIGGFGALAATAAGGLALRRLAGDRGVEARTRAGVAFGTTVALTFAGPEPEPLDAAVTAGFAAIRACEAAASLFRADSALSRLNRDGRLDRPDPHLLRLTRFALDLAEASDGAFDPTVQPLWPLWRQAVDEDRRPAPEDLRTAVALVGWRDVDVSDDRIAFRRPGMAMTLNGVLQGYAADLVVAEARRLGVPDAFVDTGEFGAYGASPGGAPWRLGLARAAGAAPDRVLDPFTGFASTSAGAGTPLSRDGQDHHIFDPRTGRSPHLVSEVTALAPSGLIADGLSTAAYVVGETRGRALADRFGASLIMRRDVV